jgi:hypothetical protein
MAKNEDRQALATQYMQLLQSGVPAAEAFKQVYPNGVPTASQQAQAASKAKQSNALAGTGGTIAGLLGVKYGSKYLESLAAEKVQEEVAKEAINQVGQEAAAQAIPATPTGLEVSSASPTSSAAAMGPTPFYVPAAAAIGTYLAGKSAYDQIKGNPEDKSVQGKAGRAQLAYSTMGMSEIARALGLGGQKSTREIARDNTKDLLKQSDNPAYQAYVQGMREQFNSAPPDPSKPFAGKYSNFNEYKAAGLDPKDLTGVYGNIKTFGPDWANLSQDQREAVTQGLIGANLYDSKKGEVVITDPQKAKAIYAGIINQPNKTVVQQPVAVARPVANTSEAFKKKTLAQTGQFGNQLLEAINR